MTMHNADPLVVETINRLLADRCTSALVETSSAAGWSPELWADLADAGFPWVGIDDAKGGSGGTIDDAAAIVRAVGFHAAPVPVAETALSAGWWMAECGLTLPVGPVTLFSGAAAVRTGRLVIDGKAPWARCADAIVVNLPMPEGHLVAALRAEQVTIQPGANMAGEARDHVTADVAINEVQHRILNTMAIASGLTELANRAALSRVIMAAGALDAIAGMTIDYTGDRRQFGKPVATFQAVQQHLIVVAQSAVKAQMAADIATRALATNTVGIEINAARIVMDEAIVAGTRAAHQAHGAIGVTREYRLHHLTRRLWSWRHEFGTPNAASQTLGNQAFAAGADALFPTIAT